MEHVERIDYTKFTDQLDVYLHITRYRLATQAIQGGHILDVGCGYGYGTKQMATAHPDKQFVAIDVDAQVISYAKAHNALPNITYIVMSATALDLPDNTYTTIISVENIEHIDDVQAYAHELARVLIPGGNLFLTTPNDDRLPHRVQRICNSTIIYNRFHVKEYTLGQLNQLRESAGLVCQKKRWLYTALLPRSLRRRHALSQRRPLTKLLVHTSHHSISSYLCLWYTKPMQVQAHTSPTA